MKSFREILGEVAEPQAGDEIEFKAKHEIELIDHPVAFDHQFSGRIDTLDDDPDDDGDFDVRHSARPADLVPPEDEDVYESTEALAETFNKDDYVVGTEPDAFKDGHHRISIKHKTKGHTFFTSGVSYKSKAKAEEGGRVFLNGYERGGEHGARKSLKTHSDHWALKEAVSSVLRGKLFNESWSDGRTADTADRAQARHISKDAAIKRIHAAGHTLASAINTPDHELLKHGSIGRKTLHFIRNFKVTEDTDVVAEGFTTISEAMKLDKVNIIHHADHPEHKAFAKAYRDAHIGDYRQGGPTEKDEKASEKFHTEYDRKTTRTGFGGSGTAIYTHKKTGKKFEVDSTPNGKGFHGTDHHVRSVREGTELEEAKRTLKTGYIKDHAWIGKTVKHRDGKVGTVTHVDREPTFSAMHPYKMNVRVKHSDGSERTARKEEFRTIKEDTVVEETETRWLHSDKKSVFTTKEKTPAAHPNVWMGGKKEAERLAAKHGGKAHRSMFGQKHYVRLSEEAEDLQELSPETLTSYKSKAEKKVKGLMKTADKHMKRSSEKNSAAYYAKTPARRASNIRKADSAYYDATAAQSKASKVASGVRLATKKLGEEIVTENFSFKAGNHTFHDGGVRAVKAEEATLLNKLYQSVGHESKAKMLDHLNSSAANFNSLLAFAAKTVGK